MPLASRRPSSRGITASSRACNTSVGVVTVASSSEMSTTPRNSCRLAAISPDVVFRHRSLNHCNCSWLPWLLWRIDEFWQMSKSGETVKLQGLPSEYFLRQCFISVDVDEDQVEWVVKKLGDDTLVFSTDYPHSDSHFPEATSLFLKLPLSEESKRKILWDNCARLYGFN